MNEEQWILIGVSAMIIVWSLRTLVRASRRQRSFDKLALLAGQMEELIKAGIPSQQSVRTQYAAIDFSARIANLYHSDGQYAKSAQTATAAITSAQVLLYGTALTAA